MIRNGEHIYFFLPQGSGIRKLSNLIFTCAIGLVSILTLLKGGSIFESQNILVSGWVLAICSFLVMIPQLVLVSPDRIISPFQMSCAFSKIKAIRFSADAIVFEKGSRTAVLKIAVVKGRKKEMATVLALMEMIQSVANLQEVEVSTIPLITVK